jgi:hypothetical protein
MNPLPNSIFTLFDVAIAFGCHIMTPFNTCLVIVVYGGVTVLVLQME